MPSEKISIAQPHHQADPSGYIRMRLHRFGVMLLVMGASFGLYYLGFFGGIDGPLSPDRIGDLLAESGITRTRLFLFLLGLMAIAGLWNIVFNLVCRLLGARLTCRQPERDGSLCSASVRRIKKSKAGDREGFKYRCEHGHVTSEAGFHRARKGVAGRTIWFTLVVFCAIFYFLI
jgi:hypothetical protein